MVKNATHEHMCARVCVCGRWCHAGESWNTNMFLRQGLVIACATREGRVGGEN